MTRTPSKLWYSKEKITKRRRSNTSKNLRNGKLKTKNYRQNLTKRIIKALEEALPKDFRTLRKRPLNSERMLEVLLASLESSWEVYLVPLSVSLAALLRESSKGSHHCSEMLPAVLECQMISTTEATAGKATKQQHNENDLDN